MGAVSLCFWFACWLCLELIFVQHAVSQLSITLLLILSAAGLLFVLELDLLGTYAAATYSSVFIALFLLLLHFGPFWAPATTATITSHLGSLFLFVLSCATLLAVQWSPFDSYSGLLGTSWSLNLLWQELYSEARVGLVSVGAALHWVFFRLLVLETVALNLYLFLSLVGVLSLIVLRQLWVDTLALAGGIAASHTSYSRYGSAGWRLRLVNKFRRQTRRTNSSQLRLR